MSDGRTTRGMRNSFPDGNWRKPTLAGFMHLSLSYRVDRLLLWSTHNLLDAQLDRYCQCGSYNLMVDNGRGQILYIPPDGRSPCEERKARKGQGYSLFTTAVELKPVACSRGSRMDHCRNAEILVFGNTFIWLYERKISTFIARGVWTRTPFLMSRFNDSKKLDSPGRRL